MRLLRQIPHEHFKVTLHHYNDKYLLSIMLDDYEQHYKVPTSSLHDIDRLEKQLNNEFYLACLKDFVSMRSRWLELINTISND